MEETLYPYRRTNYLVTKGAVGIIEVMLHLGTLYYKGRGTERNYNISFFWCKLAAEEGDPTAMNNIAYFYDMGYGVKRNVNKAFTW